MVKTERETVHMEKSYTVSGALVPVASENERILFFHSFEEPAPPYVHYAKARADRLTLEYCSRKHQLRRRVEENISLTPVRPPCENTLRPVALCVNLAPHADAKLLVQMRCPRFDSRCSAVTHQYHATVVVVAVRPAPFIHAVIAVQFSTGLIIGGTEKKQPVIARGAFTVRCVLAVPATCDVYVLD